MELFLEILCTIGLPLVLSLILAKVLSLPSYGKEGDFGFDFQTCDGKNSEKATGVVQKDVISRDESKSSDFEVGEFLVSGRESCSDEGCKDVLPDQSTEFEEIEVSNETVEDDGVKGELFGDEEDDWEDIERTELERMFGAAVSFVESGRNADRVSNLSSDVKMQLYGLHKVAIVGPCHEPQPMVLKMSARAKWNSWKRLGNMDPESAMEQYITLLSRNIPDWKHDDVDEHSGLSFEDTVACKKAAYVVENLWQN